MRRAHAGAALLALLLVGASGASAQSGDLADCLNALSARRIEACTAVIDNPATPRHERADALAARGHAHRRKGDYAAAFADYDAALAINPRAARVLNNRAWANLKSGRLEEGMADVSRSLALQPGEPNSLDTRAHLKQAMRQAEAAMLDYRMVMLLGGPDWVRRYQCGLAGHGRYKGPADGIANEEFLAALAACARDTECDPLPGDEQCRLTVS